MFIQSVLTFTLGLLIAALIAVLIAPAFWNRAVRLTRRRLEATLPMSLNEIQAEKDRVRAEYAMMARRIEIEASTQQTKANERAVEIARLNEQIRQGQKAAEEAASTIAKRDSSLAEMETRLRESEAAIKAKEAELKAQQALLDEKERAFEELSRLQEETSLVSSNRQIDLLARDSDIDRLNTTIAHLRTQRADGEQKLREQESAALKASEDLKTERRRIKDLERKNERLMSEVSDREERLERREKVLQSLQGKTEAVEGEDAPSTAAVAILAALEQERDALRAERDALKKQVEEGGSAKDDTTAAQLRVDLRDAQRREEALRLELTEAQALAMRLEAELADLPGQSPMAPPNTSRASLLALTRNGEQQQQIGGDRQASPGAVADPTLLRSELADMAAKMVHLTRVLEGPDSPIDAVLAKRQVPSSSSDKPTLADRIRALQDAASEREAAEPVQGDR